MFHRVLETRREHEVNDFGKYFENEQKIRHAASRALRSIKDNRKSQRQLYTRPLLNQHLIMYQCMFLIFSVYSNHFVNASRARNLHTRGKMFIQFQVPCCHTIHNCQHQILLSDMQFTMKVFISGLKKEIINYLTDTIFKRYSYLIPFLENPGNMQL